MHAEEATSDEVEHGRMPAEISQPIPTPEGHHPRNGTIPDQNLESAAYTSEEEALVEERLKKLGYL